MQLFGHLISNGNVNPIKVNNNSFPNTLVIFRDVSLFTKVCFPEGEEITSQVRLYFL
jgi:hypothetical protein